MGRKGKEGGLTPTTIQSEGYVTKVELARHLRVSVRTVDNMMARNDIPYLVLGRLVRFKISDVDHALEEKYRITLRESESGFTSHITHRRRCQIIPNRVQWLS